MKKITMRALLIAGIALLLQSCGAQQFTANTTASYKTGDGREVFYSSNKDQQGFKAHAAVDAATGRITAIDIEVDKSSTPEAAIKAASEAQTAMANLLNTVMQKIDSILVAAGQAAAASKGVPLPVLPRTGGINVPTPVPSVTP